MTTLVKLKSRAKQSVDLGGIGAKHLSEHPFRLENDRNRYEEIGFDEADKSSVLIAGLRDEEAE